MRILLLIALAAGLNACQPKEKKSQTDIVQIKGDPIEFVRGRHMSTNPTLLESQIDTQAKYQVVTHAFESIDKNPPKSWQDVKRDADPDRRSPVKLTLAAVSSASSPTHSWRKVETGYSSYDLAPDSLQGMTFRFRLVGGHLDLVSVANNGREFFESRGAYKLLNYSSSPDGVRHSILIYAPGTNKQLISIRIVKAESSLLELISTGEAFNYLFGKGVKAGWKEPQVLQYCAPEAPEYMYRDFKKQMAEWQKTLEGRFEWTVTRVSDCESYDNVNTRTVTFVPGWIEIPGPKMGTFGMTIFAGDFSRSSFIDSDMFIITNELKESLSAFEGKTDVFAPQGEYELWLRPTLKMIVLHELGHMLGLHHIFDGTKSVMAYDKVGTIQEYDQHAVQALYPLNNSN